MTFKVHNRQEIENAIKAHPKIKSFAAMSKRI